MGPAPPGSQRLSLVLAARLHFVLYEYRMILAFAFLAWACVFGALMPKLQPNDEQMRVLPASSNWELMKVAQQQKLHLCALHSLYTSCSYRISDRLVGHSGGPVLTPWVLAPPLDISLLDELDGQ